MADVLGYIYILTYLDTIQHFSIPVIAASLTGQWLANHCSCSWKLSDNLVVIFIDVQPTATFKRIFLHCQSLEQSDLQKNMCVISSELLNYLHLPGTKYKLVTLTLLAQKLWPWLNAIQQTDFSSHARCAVSVIFLCLAFQSIIVGQIQAIH